MKLPQFRAVNTLLGNLKTAVSGTYQAFAFAKYAHRYLAEFQYRFNRRFNVKTIMPRLLFALASAHLSGSSRWSFGKGGFRRGFSVSSWSGGRCTRQS